MELLDFTKPTWGHKMHGESMQAERASTFRVWLHDWWHVARRRSVLVHCITYPKVGDNATWLTGDGTIVAEVYKVEPCGDPKDMHKLYLRITSNGCTPYPSDANY